MTPTYYLTAALAIIWILLLSLPLTFWRVGWWLRHLDIIDSFTEAAIKAYFNAFHPSRTDFPPNGKWREYFDKYYRDQFGRRRFLWPISLFAALSGMLLFASRCSILSLLESQKVAPGELPDLALYAIAGAVLYVLSDSIAKVRTGNLTPYDVYLWTFRFAITVPMGYAAQSIFSPGIAPAIAFFSGAFPTKELMSIFRRIATQKLGFADADSGGISELQNLPGIDISKAEDFSNENITTIDQLAYCDPVRLTIRTGLTYAYVTDCICQALLVNFVRDPADQAKFQKAGLRSAYEVMILWLDLNDPTDANKQTAAAEIVKQLALQLGAPEEHLKNILRQVAVDPYAVFLYGSWSGDAMLGSRYEVLGNREPGSGHPP